MASSTKQNLLVGVLFITGTILLGFFTVLVKDVTLIEGKSGELSVIFDRVAGLEKGHKVLASGMEVGQVAELELDDNGSVRAVLSLTQPIKLYEDYKVTVKDTSALGGKYVDIEIGTSELEEVSLSQVESSPALEGTSQHSLFDDPNLRESFTSLRKIAQDIEEGKGTIGLLIQQRDIYDNLNDATKNIKEITDQIKSNQGTVGKLLYDQEMYDQVMAVLVDIKEVSGNLRSSKGTLGKLINEDEVYDEISATLVRSRKVMSNLYSITSKIRKGEGTVGKLIVQDDIYRELDLALKDARNVMSEINQAVKQMNDGKGTLASLLNDEEMAADLKETLGSLKIVAKRLETGEGTIGKLLADETVYKEIEKLIKNFSDSLEDTREQVPITTFTNILFKAF